MTSIQQRQLGFALAGASAVYVAGAALCVVYWLLHNPLQILESSGAEGQAEELIITFEEALAEPGGGAEIAQQQEKKEGIQFVRTSGLPEAEKPPEPGDAKFLSDRNTTGASETDPNPVGPRDLPSQKGEDSPVLDLTNKNFADGERNGAERQAVGLGASQPEPVASTPPPQPPAAPPEPPPPAMAQTEPPPVPADTPPPPPEQPEEAPLAATDSVPVPKAKPVEELPKETLPVREPVWEKLIPKVPQDTAEANPKTPAEAVKPPDKSVAGNAGSKQGSDQKAFQTFTKKSALAGSISNKGKSSVDAADTPAGRYMARVGDAVSQKFHPACQKNRGKLTYGVVRVEFDINPRGGRENLRILDDSQSNAAMQDLVLGAILDADVPPLPKELSEYLIGERLHITYSFRFN
jgi:TonB family protein